MDKMSKLFLVMLFGSLLFGSLILAFNPDYRKDAILKSNAHYFPHAGSSPDSAPVDGAPAVSSEEAGP